MYCFIFYYCKEKKEPSFILFKKNATLGLDGPQVSSDIKHDLQKTKDFFFKLWLVA